MPEFVEVEAYRRTALPVRGCRIDAIDIADERLLRRGEEAPRVYGILGAAAVRQVRRTGKRLFFDLSPDHTLCLTFGLRGRLLLDGEVARPDGHRRSVTPREEHIRLSLCAGGHELLVEDQLRLATVEIDFDEESLGIDVLSLDKASFRRLLGESDAAVKSLLMDQRRIAGIGNLVADEVLYQGRIDPRRPAGSIDEDELDDLWRGLRRTRTRLLKRGGSHRGVLIKSGARRRGGRCTRCDVEIRRSRVGGRTTYFCPEHQI